MRWTAIIASSSYYNSIIAVRAIFMRFWSANCALCTPSWCGARPDAIISRNRRPSCACPCEARVTTNSSPVSGSILSERCHGRRGGGNGEPPAIDENYDTTPWRANNAIGCSRRVHIASTAAAAWLPLACLRRILSPVALDDCWDLHGQYASISNVTRHTTALYAANVYLR